MCSTCGQLVGALGQQGIGAVAGLAQALAARWSAPRHGQAGRRPETDQERTSGDVFDHEGPRYPRAVTDQGSEVPGSADACSLVDAFRSGERSPVEELDASLAAIASSDLNCFSLPRRRSGPRGRRARPTCRCRSAECPPASRSSSRWRAGRGPRPRSSTATAGPRRRRTVVERLVERGGAVPVGQTTASEFGGLNVSVTKLNGVTHNPWRHGRTVGGSSAGSAAAVVGRAGQPGHRRRRRRLDPHPGRLHRSAGHEGHVRPHPAWAPRLHATEHGRARQPGPLGPRRGSLLRRVRGRGPLRPDQPSLARRLGGRARDPGPGRATRRHRSRPRRRHARARGRGPRAGDRPRR